MKTKRELKEFEKENRRMLMIKLCVYLPICALFVLSLFLSNFFESLINKTSFDFEREVINSSFKVHFIDVGQGDCCLIELPDKTHVMIDTGEKDSFQKVKKYLKAINFDNRIDYLILTHTDKDHIGSAKLILENFEVKNVFRPKVYSSYEIENGLDFCDFNENMSSVWNETVKAIFENVEPANIFYNEVGAQILSKDDSYSFYFLSPKEDNYTNDNDYSAVVMFRCFENKFLFMGDAEEKIENELLSAYHDGYFDESDLKCDVLKVAHHGSKGSTSKNFLEIAKPEMAVISCGLQNSNNHPSNAVINNLIENDTKIFRTDRDNSVLFYLNENSLCALTNYDSLPSFYFEWYYFVITFIVLSGVVVFSFKRKS